MRRQSKMVPGLGFRWVSRADVDKTQPALQRAGYRCECCPRGDGLRVVEGKGEVVVLCPECAMDGGFKLVVGRRRAMSVADDGAFRRAYETVLHRHEPAFAAMAEHDRD